MKVSWSVCKLQTSERIIEKYRLTIVRHRFSSIQAAFFVSLVLQKGFVLQVHRDKFISNSFSNEKELFDSQYLS